MITFLFRVGMVVAAVAIFDALVVAFLVLFNAADAALRRRADWVEWEREVARSARETAMRQHPAGGRQ